MASMVDRGDSYHVIYLGSCMLAQVATGLNVLQKPLRELYFKYRQPGGGPAAQERFLRMSGRGMTMTYRMNPQGPTQEDFYAVPSILFWDAVQFVAVRGRDKKIHAGFEPLDNDHSRNKDNVYLPLEKKHQFLQQMTHPPLFTCVLRRTSGVKALDVHAFVCSNDDEAIGLVRALNMIQATYQSEELHESGVFGYKPFGGQREGGGSQSGSLLDLSSSGQRSKMGSQAGSVRSSYSEYSSQQAPVRSHNTPSQLAVAAINKSVSHRSSVSSSASSSDNPRVFQLTQNDFIPVSSPSVSDEHPDRRHIVSQTEQPWQPEKQPTSHPSPISRQQGARFQASPQKWQPAHSPAGKRHPQQSPGPRQQMPVPVPRVADTEEHVYQYIQHIGDDKPKPASSVISSSPSVFVSTLGVRENQAPIRLPQARQQYGSITRSIVLDDETLRPQSLSRPSGQPPGGYRSSSLEQASRVGPRIQEEDYLRYVESPNVSPTRNRSGSPTYNHNIASSLNVSAPRDTNHVEYANDHFERTPPLPAPRQYPVPKKAPSPKRDSHSSSNSEYSRPFGGVSDNRDQNHKPVATVLPRKVQGYQVLPSQPSVSKRSTESRSGVTKPYLDDSGVESTKHFADPPRRTKSQFMDTKGNGSGNRQSSAKVGSNWEFGPTHADKDHALRTLKPDEVHKEGDKTMNEKFLRGQKKDAEIASAMQDMSFDYEGPEVTPSRTNFEAALGYLP